MSRKQAQVEARTSIDVPFEAARRWFLDLKDHPDRYQFASHAGFRFTQGGFGEVGARFETEEVFLGLRLRLGFELAELSEARDCAEIVFRLLHPPLPVMGAFKLLRRAADETDLSLTIWATKGGGRLFLRLPLVRGAIRGQIEAEVNHIKRSMENLHQDASGE
jgi:hypothetical protein